MAGLEGHIVEHSLSNPPDFLISDIFGKIIFQMIDSPTTVRDWRTATSSYRSLRTRSSYR